MSKYSVVIPSLYKIDKDYLKLCVESLRASGFDGEVIVVTNGTPLPEPLDIRGITKRLHTRDQGQCIATNIGVSAATSDWVLVSNSDMYYAPGWDNYISHDDDWSRIIKLKQWVFSPNLIEPINNAGSAPPFLKFDGGLTVEEFNKKVVDNFVREKVSQGKDKPYWSFESYETGFNLPFFIKKDLWDFLKGYDTAFDPWGSNSDTCLQTRINLAGVIPMRLRDVLVYHFSNKSGTFDGTHQAEYQHNLEYFKSKFGFDRDELGSDVWYNKDMIPTDKEKIKYVQPRFQQS